MQREAVVMAAVEVRRLRLENVLRPAHPDHGRPVMHENTVDGWPMKRGLSDTIKQQCAQRKSGLCSALTCTMALVL